MGSVKLKTMNLMLNPSISTTMRLQFGELNITPRVASRLHELDFTVPELEDAINDHKRLAAGAPSICCGAYDYGKCNGGVPDGWRSSMITTP